MGGGGELHVVKETVRAATGETITGGLAVKITGEAFEARTADDTDTAIDGVAIYDAAEGEASTIVKQGVVKATSGAAYADNAPLTVDSAGKFIAATSTDPVHARAREAAGGADEERLIEVYPAAQAPVLP